MRGSQVLCSITPFAQGLAVARGSEHNKHRGVVFLELRRDSRVTTGISAFPLGWPWEAQSSPRVARDNQSILKEISPGYSLEGLMLKLKLQSLAT